MKLEVVTNANYMLRIGDYQSAFFDRFESGDAGVDLYIGALLVAVLHFDQADEFYKAWRAYQCSI